jgi:hypothetical protein
LNIDENISSMKKIIHQSKISEVDELVNRKKGFNALNLLMVTPLKDENNKIAKEISKEIESKLQQESSKNPLSTSTIML